MLKPMVGEGLSVFLSVSESTHCRASNCPGKRRTMEGVQRLKTGHMILLENERSSSGHEGNLQAVGGKGKRKGGAIHRQKKSAREHNWSRAIRRQKSSPKGV